MILREMYLERIIPFIDSPFIKILTGVRRSGTTTILQMIQQELERREVPKSRILIYNFDMYNSDTLKSSIKLYQDIKSKISDGGKTYIFLDDVQEVEDWEKTVNSIICNFDVDIYAVCSNSLNLYEELSQSLKGKYVQFKVYPLSFSEYLSFRKSRAPLSDIYTEFVRFVKIGGLPLLNKYDCSSESIHQMLRDTLSSIIFTDILRSNRVRKTDVFSVVVRKLINQAGLPFSFIELSEYLNSRGLMVDYDMLNNYINLLQKAGIIQFCQRYDIKEQNIIKYGEKFYLADHSFLNSVIGNFAHASERILSNIVFLELKRRGYEVWSGKNNSSEIDFIGFRQNSKIYIQIESNKMGDKSGLRAIEQLGEIQDEHPKYLLKTDSSQTVSSNGICVMHIADFLVSDLF